MIEGSLTIAKIIIKIAVINFLLIPVLPSFAQDTGSTSDFKITGFLSVVGGKILGGNLDANYAGATQINGNNCPCYTADWNNAGIYTKNFSLKPESRVGIQAHLHQEWCHHSNR